MIAVRKGLVFAVLLIAALVLAATVSAAHPHPAPGTFNLTTAPAPAPVPTSTAVPHTMDAATRATYDALVAGDMSALAPPSTVFESVHPGQSLQDAIDAAAPGSTIYLDPGIYYEHDLFVDKTIHIKANETLGGTSANTIIDARSEGRIFTVAGGFSALRLENLTLRNGFVDGDGGAVSAPDGIIILVSSTITNCSATGYGGALSSSGMAVVVYKSTFSRCSATGPEDYSAGGAIFSEGLLLFIDNSTFTDCSAPDGWGGAVESDSVFFEVMSSTFTRCSAIDGGALDFYDYGATIIESTFTDCTAARDGGAMWYLEGGYTHIVGSSFTRCLAAVYGGAIAGDGDLTVESSTFTGCSTDGVGGAIFTERAGTFIVTSSTFTGCSADAMGGAIAAFNDVSAASVTFSGCSAGIAGGAVLLFFGSGDFVNSTFTGCTTSGFGGAVVAARLDTLTITSSTITGCSAVDGGAIWSSHGTNEIHFCRIYGNTASGTGPAINTTVPVDATQNWWGTNSDPAALVNGPVTYDPWLVLGITADPASITVPQTSYIRTNLTYNSDGTNTAGGGIYLPNAIPNAYAVISGPGAVSPVSAGSASGGAQTTFITLQPGTTTIAGTVDGQTVYITLDVAQGTWTPPPTEVPNDDDWPQVGGGASGGGGGGSGSAATTGSSGFPLMTVTVNIGGDSKAWQAIVTGTKLSDLIVTGNVQYGAGGNFTPPPGIVFQYISLVPARYDTVTNAVINFTVPQSWLEENHIDPGSIVLYRLTPNGWEALPATVLYTKDGTVYFSAVSPGFSLFAIAGTPTVLTPLGVTAILEPVSAPAAQEQVPAPAAVAKAPVTTQTTAPPAPSSVPAGSSPFPVIPALIGLGCVGLIGGGWYARRWWIRRQNPALFREYD